MQLISIVDDYCWALARKATVQELDEGGLAATVPSAPGVVASGDDRRECILDLLSRLEDWVAVGLEAGWQFPVVDGIDLNSEEGASLVRHHRLKVTPIEGEFFESEDELEAAFARWEKTD